MIKERPPWKFMGYDLPFRKEYEQCMLFSRGFDTPLVYTFISLTVPKPYYDQGYVVDIEVTFKYLDPLSSNAVSVSRHDLDVEKLEEKIAMWFIELRTDVAASVLTLQDLQEGKIAD